MNLTFNSSIGLGNFSINNSNVSTGYFLINNTFVNISKAYLTRRNDTFENTTSLFVYLDVPSTNILSGFYKSTNSWIIQLS